MSDIPEDITNALLVKCGRRCCVCRRYRPTKLQVHHIKEKSQGGTDDEDNLIALCMSCHSDIHTKVPFARRFTQEEQKMHRAALIGQVERGVLPAEDDDDTDRAIRAVVQDLAASTSPKPSLIAQAVELLLHASDPSAGSQQGRIIHTRSMHGSNLSCGKHDVFNNENDARKVAAYQHAREQLVRSGLAEKRSESLTIVTYEGYLVADELRAAGPAAIRP